MGRPPILPKKKKDGWYIEVRNKGAKSGLITLSATASTEGDDASSPPVRNYKRRNRIG